MRCGASVCPCACTGMSVGCRRRDAREQGGGQPAAPGSRCASLYLPQSPSSLPFPFAAFYAARPRLQGLGIFPGFPSWGLAALILGTSQFCFLAAQLRNSACAGRRAWPFPTAAGFVFVLLPPAAGSKEILLDTHEPLLEMGLTRGCSTRMGLGGCPGLLLPHGDALQPVG